MKLVIGLGNPGNDYLKTRHNVGFMVIDALNKNKSNKSSNYVVLKSTEFMNDSGDFVKKMIDKYSVKSDELFVIHDDLDILLGSYKIQFGRGPKDHNGISSVDESLASSDYWHVRVGVDKRDPQNRVLGKEYVLQNFSDEEMNVLSKTINEVCKKLVDLLTNSN